MKRLRVAALDELWIDELTACRAGTRRLVVLRSSDGLRAYENRCPHLGLPLSQGKLDGCVLSCAAHGWQFDLRTGQGINPASAQLSPVSLEIENGEVFALLEENADG